MSAVLQARLGPTVLATSRWSFGSLATPLRSSVRCLVMAHVRPLYTVATGSREQGSRGNRWERSGDGFLPWSRACNPMAVASAVILLGGSNAQCEGRGEEVPEQDLGSVGGKDALTVLDHIIARLRELLIEVLEALKRIAEGTKVGIVRAIDGAKPMMEHVLAHLIEFSKNTKERFTDAVDQAKPLADHAVEKLNHLFVKATEIGSAAIDQTKPMVEKALAIVAGAVGVVLDVLTSQQKSVTKQSSTEEKKDQAAEEPKGGKGAACVVDEEHQELVVSAWPEKYRQYLPLFVLGAICGGMLGFLLLKRTRDVEYAKIAAQKVCILSFSRPFFLVLES